MASAKFDGFEIRVRSITESYEDIAETGRTAGGKERRDAIAAKRAWEVETPPMPLSKVTPLEDHLRAIVWGYGDWWYRDFGDESNTVRARIDAASWTKTRVQGVPGYVQVSFRVIEQ